MVSNVDHIAGKTGLGANITVMLSKGNAGTGTAAGNSLATIELDGVNMPGWYQLNLTGTDTNTIGDLAFHCTGTGADPTDFVDQVQTTVFTDLTLTAGRVSVTTNLQQGATFTALFFMTTTGTNTPAPGLTVTGQRTFGAGFSTITGTIAEVGGVGAGGGWYVLNGAALDSGGACVGFKMSASGANDSDFTLWMQP
jgi:hypothetical protein